MEWYLGKNCTMPAYCYNLLIDTAIMLTGTVIMHDGIFITLVDNDTMLAGSYNLFAGLGRNAYIIFLFD